MPENIHYIAYCGLYCRDCLIFTAEIADLAKELKKKLIQYDFSRVARGLSTILEDFREFKNYKQCYEVLEAMDRLRCERICREGGGNAVCKIRICCQNMNINGCWECQEFESCDMLESLKPVNEDAPVKNLRILKTRESRVFSRVPNTGEDL
jgi:hypothetical protein